MSKMCFLNEMVMVVNDEFWGFDLLVGQQEQYEDVSLGKL